MAKYEDVQQLVFQNRQYISQQSSSFGLSFVPVVGDSISTPVCEAIAEQMAYWACCLSVGF